MTHTARPTTFTGPGTISPAAAARPAPAQVQGVVRGAAEILRRGGLVAFPTETVYGLGADAENAEAVRRVFEVKRRPVTHPLIVHLADSGQLGDWVTGTPGYARVLAEWFWPGPLTLVLPRSPRIPSVVTGGCDTVAVRVPHHPVAQRLLTAFGGAIAAPSANRFGAVSCTSAEHVADELGPAVDLILDSGPCPVGIESTIIDVTGDEPILLRPGAVGVDDLARALGRPIRTTTPLPGHRAPGQHPSHYAPRARVVLVEESEIVAEADRQQSHGLRVGVLRPPASTASITIDSALVIDVPTAIGDYARDLYRLLREFDRHDCEVVIASLPTPAGVGLAIADRLTRASAPRPAGTASTSTCAE
ncbi:MULTISPECIES: L-threonylcarbamoyladenylate synthase [Micrococcales]|uniref:Threonylcarbamoyl-AMP synthase n=2 Tax=Promicromonospora TaxID=43676 RepID=A0ABW4V852_9MICO|nr:L-threonylcarbamoyladenylate synthase [Sediminivirga luteola]MCI2267207.1 threonylcarbamoyl-AMP synthase [Sediminivirga luteola]